MKKILIFFFFLFTVLHDFFCPKGKTGELWWIG